MSHITGFSSQSSNGIEKHENDINTQNFVRSQNKYKAIKPSPNHQAIIDFFAKAGNKGELLIDKGWINSLLSNSNVEIINDEFLDRLIDKEYKVHSIHIDTNDFTLLLKNQRDSTYIEFIWNELSVWFRKIQIAFEKIESFK